VNYSAIPSGTLIGRLLRVPLRLVPHGTHVRILQGPIRGKRWIVGSSDHGCWLGSYEYEKQRRFAAAISSGDVVYDVGAHVGFYSLVASAIAGPTGRVFSFEPVPENLALLRQHIKLNGATNCAVWGVAVSNSNGTAGFNIGPSSTSGHLGDERLGSISVPTVTLDDMVISGKLPPPNVLKMDIEGGECNALSGSVQVLEKYSPKIFLATHGPDLHKICCGLLTDYGYQLESLDHLPIDKTSEVLAVPRT